MNTQFDYKKSNNGNIRSLEEKLQHILAACITHGFNDANSGISEPTTACRLFAKGKLEEIKALFDNEVDEEAVIELAIDLTGMIVDAMTSPKKTREFYVSKIAVKLQRIIDREVRKQVKELSCKMDG